MIAIGTSDGKPIGFDLDVLLRTRLLLQANSGGGKSWALRRLAEQLWGKVQVIIIDPEGEFSTLREVADYVLVGKGGDTPADVRSAALLATKLLELRASAVCDLYEMKIADRHAWVMRFLSAIVDAPKRLWHSVVVVIDEAHVFAPEKGYGESIASEAVAAIATRGRKRGFCAVLATQRIGKLRKDVAAELQNVLIGSTFLDIDVGRAADALGVPKAERREFEARVKVMEPGNFFALGRAISTSRTMLKVGPVKSTHPEPGAELPAEPPPPTASIRKLLPQLADLPKEVERKEATEAELRSEVSRLRAELAARPMAAVATHTVPAISEADFKRVERLSEKLVAEHSEFLNHVGQRIDRLAQAEQAIVSEVGNLLTATRMAGSPITAQPSPKAFPRSPRAALGQAAVTNGHVPAAPSSLAKGEAAVLNAIAQHDAGVTRVQLTVLTGYKRSTRDAYLQRLRVAGLVEEQGDRIVATTAAVAALGDAFQPLPTGEALREHWRRELPEGEAKILDILVKRYPSAVSRDEVGDQTGYARSSRDAYLQRLAARELVVSGSGGVTASETLFG